MINITKKKFNRIVRELKIIINNNINDMEPSLKNELDRYKLWPYWSQNVRINYFSTGYNITKSRKIALQEFIKYFKKELIL